MPHTAPLGFTYYAAHGVQDRLAGAAAAAPAGVAAGTSASGARQGRYRIRLAGRPRFGERAMAFDRSARGTAPAPAGQSDEMLARLRWVAIVATLVITLAWPIASRTGHPLWPFVLVLAGYNLLVGLHDGRLWAESSAGEGATFHVVLPRRSDVGRAAT